MKASKEAVYERAHMLEVRVHVLETIVRTVATLDLGPKGYCSGCLAPLVEQARSVLKIK